MKYWKTDVVVESEILSDLFQSKTHQQIIVLQNSQLREFYKNK